eukprot:TRINITY_DN7825_c0_g1_i1.p1 TRINITY_DN7825_c0_g1~~TRINITY_DN7825_c0_g1_i1.p1  ORF type:complete len:836 (-),score=197.95 TRINITY_DN7825_c0_g1_i1:20-2527(-)
MSKLQALYEESRRLTAHIDNHGLPLLQRGVEQIDEISRRMYAKATRSAVAGDAGKNKAHYLLANRGFDADRLTRTLGGIELKASTEPLEPLLETDVAGFLRHHHRMTVLTAIEESKKYAIDEFEQAHSLLLDQDWAQVREDMLHTLSHLGRVQTAAATADYSRDVSMTMATPGRHTTATSAMTPHMLEYSRLVYELNRRAKEGLPAAVASAALEIARVARDIPEQARVNVMDMWRMLRSVVSERDASGWEFQKHIPNLAEMHERYANNDVTLKQQLLDGALCFLQEQYVGVIKSTISNQANVRQAAHNDGLTIVDDIKAFLNVKYEHGQGQKDWPAEFEAIWNHYPVWPIIYYCMRCGDFDSAVAVAGHAEDQVGPFSAYLREYIIHEGRLPTALRQKILSEYHNLERNPRRDPFKLLVYNVVGRCDARKNFGNVCPTTQDFMWMKLMLTRLEDVQDELHNEITLPELQQTLVQYGPGHFNKGGRSPLLYFQVLVLSQQFERAVSFLFSVDHLQVEAVHAAIALQHYGLLRQPPSTVPDMFVVKDNTAMLHFGKLIRSYARSFSGTDPKEALQYFVTIHDADFKYQCIKSLVLESKEFDLLLGCRTMNGSLQPGAISSVMQPSDVKAITSYAAKESADHGRYADAVKLYDLAEEYDDVVGLLVKQLSQVVATPSSQRNELKSLATDVSNIYRDTGAFQKLRDPQLASTFELILNLLTFFDLYNSSHFDEALNLIAALNLIPLDMSSVDTKAEAAVRMTDPVTRNLGSILLATMQCIYHQFTQLRSHSLVFDAQRESALSQLKDKSHALVAFAGMLQYRLPGDTVARLIRSDVMLR